MNRVKPESVGVDAAQLGYIETHLKQHYIDAGKIPGSLTLVARKGQVCYLEASGQRDVARAIAMTEDTIFRIYSMTKPITSLALMTIPLIQ